MNKSAFSFLTDEQVRQLFQEELSIFFSETQINKVQEPKQNQVVDLDGLLQARPFIGSRSTLYKKISKGLIPHSKQGKKLYFDLNEIDEWLLKYKVKPIDKLHQEYNKRKK